MSLERETQECMRVLGVGELPLEWADAVWEHNFCESVSLPAEASEAVLSVGAWEAAVAVCRQWASRREEEEESGEGGGGAGFWSALLDAHVPHKLLLALLYCILDSEKQRREARLCAVHAAQLYVVLLQVPGSSAFKLFHPMLFQKALDTLLLFPDSVKADATAAGKKGVGTRGRRGKRKRNQVEEEEGEGGEGCEGGGEEIARLLRQLIQELQSLLSVFALSGAEASRYQLVQALLRTARTETTTAPSSSSLALGEDTRSDALMFVQAWRCLELLCQPLHGPVDKIASEVFRQLLPAMLMLTPDGAVSTPLPSHLTTLSLHTLTFTCHLHGKYGKAIAEPLKALLQHVCTRAPDKADYRSKLATVVVKLLALFSTSLYSQLLEWIYKFSRNTKVGHRVFALDIVSELLLGQPLREEEEEGEGEGSGFSDEERHRLSYKFLLKMVLSRCSDRAPSVRSRALVCLSAVAAPSSRPALREALKQSIFTDAPEGGGVLLAMVRRRASDEKVGVRRAAIAALEGLARSCRGPTTTSATAVCKEDVGVIHERCLDPALSVRKQALTSLTALLLDQPHSTTLQKYWLDGVLPMVTDREAGAQDKCLQVLDSVLLSNITSLENSTSEEHQFSWELLSLLSSSEGGGRQDLLRYLRRALELWAKAGRLPPSIVAAAASHTHCHEHLKAAWMLVAEMSQFTATFARDFLLASWRQYGSQDVAMETGTPLVQVLVTIGNTPKVLGKAATEDIKDDILSLLSSFALPPVVIQAAVNTLCQLCAALTSNKTYQATLSSWCKPLLEACEQYLASSLQLSLSAHQGGPPPAAAAAAAGEGFEGEREKKAICYLFTLGEVAQLCPSLTSQHVCLMVQSLLLASAEPHTSSHPPSPSSSSSSSSSSEQLLLPSLSGLSELSLSSTLRAHAYITLGKLCLQNEELAKKSVVQMARELETSLSATIRNNIIIILCDLAVRYSAKVDPYIPIISSSLKDNSLLVRKQTLTLLAQLLQEDYIKWKGSLFFRFVAALVDEELNHFAEFCLVHVLLVRSPAIFFSHFVECVFHFNSYEKHKVYNQFKQTEREKELFSLAGERNASKRRAIYAFLLSHVADEHRFQLTAKLCQDVLSGLVDGAIALDGGGVGVVTDTLRILTCKEIKLSSLRRNVSEELSEEGDQVGAAVATAQNKIISQIVKRNVIENIVPIIISCKHYLEQARSPLLRDLLAYLKELMQDYRSEVSDILASDRQLAEEIEFDLKRYEEDQKKLAREQTPTLSVTPHAQMISPLLSPGALGTPAVATPPRLRTPGVQRSTPIRGMNLNTPFRLPMGMSPLVVTQKKAANYSTPSRHQPTSHTTVTKTTTNDIADMNSPVAARARVNMVNADYSGYIVSPAKRLEKIPLQKAVLMSAAMKKVESDLPPSLHDTVQVKGGSRVASTPQGFAESICFNVSSLVPPSPIPANATLASYCSKTAAAAVGTGKTGLVHAKGPMVQGRRGKKAILKLPQAEGADIFMLSPAEQPRKLSKWNVKL